MIDIGDTKSVSYDHDIFNVVNYNNIIDQCEMGQKNWIPLGILLWKQSFLTMVANDQSNHHTKFEVNFIN